MLRISIDEAGWIKIDNKDTGLSVDQCAAGTILCRREIRKGWSASFPDGQRFKVLPLPNERYELSPNKQESKVPGLKEFEVAVLAYVNF